MEKLIKKLKNWNIKRKSKYILCPYCLFDYHSVVKFYADTNHTIIPKPLFKCEKCGKIFSWQGKKLNDEEINEILEQN